MRSVLSVTLKQNIKYAAYLKLINGILNLTPKQLRVLAAFMDLNASSPCSSDDRKKVKQDLKLTNVNVYVKIFLDRGLIKKQDKWKYTPSSIIVPPDEGVNINIKWT